jgi:hypothetical protein
MGIEEIPFASEAARAALAESESPAASTQRHIPRQRGRPTLSGHGYGSQVGGVYGRLRHDFERRRTNAQGSSPGNRGTVRRKRAPLAADATEENPEALHADVAAWKARVRTEAACPERAVSSSEVSPNRRWTAAGRKPGATTCHGDVTTKSSGRTPGFVPFADFCDNRGSLKTVFPIRPEPTEFCTWTTKPSARRC